MFLLTMALVPDKATVVAGEPVTLKFSATNAGAAPIILDLGLNRQGAFHFDVQAPNGSVTQVTPPLPEGADVTVRVSRFQIDAGATYTQRLWLGKWYSFDHPGLYVVTVALEGLSECLHDRTFLITVDPADEDRLRSVCAALLWSVLELGTAEYEAAWELASIEDPLAIPYVEAMLAGRGVARESAITALGRFSVRSLAATRALMNLSHTADLEDRRHVKFALMRVAQITRDEGIRAEIVASGLLN